MRTCFLCGEAVPLERRATVFCSLRCETLYGRMRERGLAGDPSPGPTRLRPAPGLAAPRFGRTHGGEVPDSTAIGD